MNKYLKLAFIYTAFLIIILGFLFLTPVSAHERIRVFVSILPQKYFVNKIGKDYVDIQVMVEPGANPAAYEPKPSQMRDLSRATLYFAIGVPFENIWLKKITSANPKMKIIQTDQGIQKIPMPGVHPHDNKEESELVMQRQHDGRDPHIWLSPPYVMIQAHNILIALQEADPVNRWIYEENYRTFIIELMKLDGELREVFRNSQGLQFMVFHPSWGYFAHTYGLRQLPIEVEGKEPKPAQLKAIIKRAKENNIKVIFAQPQFSTKSARQLASEVGGKVILVDPLSEDWAENLKKQTKVFKEVLR